MDLDNTAANLIMTHWCAQRFFKWIPFPRYAALDQNEWLDVLQWPQKAWAEFSQRAVAEPVGAWPWREALKKMLVRHNLAACPDMCPPNLWWRFGPIAYLDSRYPASLRAIGDPPAVIFTRGDAGHLLSPMIAVVGSRKASRFALEQTKSLAESLALRGVTVVSGGALGCDAMAHWGALRSGIRPVPTVVVLAGGVDQLYPRINHVLFAQIIAAGGLLISERLPGRPCRPMDFPVRNRLISGMSQGVAIMQAAHHSGAMVTVRLALDQGRDVWVLRHPQGDVRADGSEALIGDGAASFEEYTEFIASL
jgi:DNA protecting protein DprA